MAVATAELTSSVKFYRVGNPGYHNVGIPGIPDCRVNWEFYNGVRLDKLD